MPDLYIITGSNGAGKSSVGASYLPKHIQQSCTVFDGDKLFVSKQKELWASGITAHKEARNIAKQFLLDTFDDLVDKAIASNSNFAYEGHFINEASWLIPTKFKDKGYHVRLIFFGLRNPDDSELRVIDRVKEGGHYVQRIEIENNYYGNLEKLNEHFTVLDSLTIYDTTETEHQLLIDIQNSKVVYSLDTTILPNWVIAYLPNIVKMIEQ